MEEPMNSDRNASEKLERNLLTRWVESFFGKKLSGLAFYVTHSIGAALNISVPTALGLFVLSHIIVKEMTVQARIYDSVLYFSTMFIIFFITSFSSHVYPILLKRTMLKNEKLTAIVIFLISGIVASICIMLLIRAPFLIADEKLGDAYGKSDCEQAGNCELNVQPSFDASQIGNFDATIELGPDDSISSTDTDGAVGLNENMSIAELNQWLIDNGQEEFDINDRANLFESSLSSVLERSEIENWSKYFVDLDRISATKPAYTGLHISKGISSGASFDIIVEILNRGYALNGSHVSMLATKLNVRELKELENYGVDLTAQSADGNNALVAALFNENRSQVFDYLLTKDQLVSNDSGNVVREVMRLSSILKLDFSYAQKVIDKGGSLSNETVNWIGSELKQSDAEYYQKVKEHLASR